MLLFDLCVEVMEWLEDDLSDDLSDFVLSEADSDERASCEETSDDANDKELPNDTSSKQSTFAPLNPHLYVSHTFYSFDKKSYDLMKNAIQDNVSMTLEALKSCDTRDMLDLKRWRKMKENICLGQNEDGSFCLYLKASPKLKISYIEEWESIVQACHTMADGKHHQGIDDTLQTIKSTWCVDIRRHGIPISYVKDLLNVCDCKRVTKKVYDGNVSLVLPKNDPTQLLAHKKSVDKSNVDRALMEIMIEYKVRLVRVRSSKNHGQCKMIVDYACHRGGKPHRMGTRKRLRTSKKCGCPFKVRIEYLSDTNIASISLYPIHEGHVPGTRKDLYQLPIHPHVIECCMEDLFDVGSSRHVAKMSTSKETLHKERASPLDQIIYRFFMIQKEISMMSYQIRNQGTMNG